MNILIADTAENIRATITADGKQLPKSYVYTNVEYIPFECGHKRFEARRWDHILCSKEIMRYTDAREIMAALIHMGAVLSFFDPITDDGFAEAVINGDFK